jgi:sugar phosphate isomerase/epimerase
MKRITRLFGFLILTFMAATFFSCEAPREDKFIGLQLWSVRGDMNADPAGTLRQVGEMGYSFVEAAGYQDGRFYNMEPKAFAALVEENGMEFISSHINRTLPSDDEWDEAIEWWEKAIHAHLSAGVSYIVIPTMRSSAFESLEELKKWADYFNLVGQMCKDHGLGFGFHNHAIEFSEVEGVVAYDFLLENTDPDLVFFQIDLYWIVEGGKDFVDYFQRYPGRFLMYHTKDREEVGASGTIDFEAAYRNADLAGMRYHIVEVEQYNYEPIESVRISLEYLLNAGYVKADYR